MDLSLADAAARPTAYETSTGRQLPLGATPDAGGVNFSIFSEAATSIELLLFRSARDVEPFQVVALDPVRHRTFHFWHVYVHGARAGLFYAYRVDGPQDLSAGHRFNPRKVLIDPYSKGNSKALWQRGDACGDGDNLATSLRSVVIDPADYDWEGDAPLRRPMAETVIYEMHVGGFTRSPSSGVAHPGTFAGVIEKIPYLKALGVTAVELLPVFEFDESDTREFDGRRLSNYWGYSTMSYFAPHPGYCISPEAGRHVTEFRDMVKALHRAGIEVILDVVYNHTDEGNHQGPAFCFKGIDNATYYYLSPQDRRYYEDYTGCGNTFNCNHPIPEKLIIDSLRYWVSELHVDGFRFDEASVLSRGEDGAPLPHPPVIWAIELDDVLIDSKVIAEAWDAAGLYQVGHFPGHRWAEWNGKYRDDVRRFVKGDGGLLGSVAARVSGSPDLYEWSRHEPVNSINFIIAHDGFTLNDLVSYNVKHNEANGEGNRDGVDDNMSWNCGVEGPTDDPAVEALRERQIKNFAAILLTSQGVPMMGMGDEVRRTQGGNNNAYCQDNEIGWFDWTLVEKHAGMLRFWQRMIAFRRQHPTIHRPRYFNGMVNARGLRDLSWHGCDGAPPNWGDPDARAVAFTLGGQGQDADIHVIMNMYWEPLSFVLPDLNGRVWRRAVDTSLPSPDDIAEPGHETPVAAGAYRAGPRSIAILIAPAG
jgi:glycogen operon protein